MLHSKISSLVLALTLPLSAAFAADLVVESGGTYTTIQAAINAASNGDRIIVRNQSVSTPWIGNFTINKTLDLLSYDNNTQFNVQGNVTIEMGSGRTVNIIGMNNMVGNIAVSGGSGTTKINITDCTMANGYINLRGTSVEGNVYSTTVTSGYIDMSYGDVIGCNINSVGKSGYPVGYNNAYTGSYANPNLIIGNKTTSDRYSAVYYLNNNTFVIKNNFCSLVVASYAYGITINNFSPASAGTLGEITNNTIRMTSNPFGYDAYGILLETTTANASIILQNNVIADDMTSGNGTSYGIRELSASSFALVNAGYNYIDSGVDYEFSDRAAAYTANSNTSQAFALNSDGSLSGGVAAVNGANPDNKYADLDLSRGDAGAYGGSYTLNNFHPLQTGAAKVFFVQPSANIFVQGQTLNVNAWGFDR